MTRGLFATMLERADTKEAIGLNRSRLRSTRTTRAGYTCLFTAREARYLRIRQTHNSANTGRHLVEVMAFPE